MMNSSTAYNKIDISAIVQIDDWVALDEELAGSRVKRTVAEPETDNLYVFKEPKPQREAQIWSELIASFIAGDLLDWPVQHAQIAMKNGQIGNLLEYVYDPHSHIFLAGDQFCKHIDPDFDPKQGRRHTWALIKRLRSGTILDALQEDAYFQFWAKAIAFDTLISNTDRHAENWAVLRPNKPEADLIEMASLYDNASSMGCEVDKTGLDKWFSKDGKIIDSKVLSYIQNGCHHLRNGNARYRFEELARQFISDFPTLESEFISVAELDLKPIESVLDEICAMSNLPEVARMTSRRRQQIMRLLHEGQMRTIRALSE